MTGGMVFVIVAVPLFSLLAAAQVLALLRRGGRCSRRAAVFVSISSLVLAAVALFIILAMLLHRLVWQEWHPDPLPLFAFWGIVCAGATLSAYLNYRLGKAPLKADGAARGFEVVAKEVQ